MSLVDHIQLRLFYAASSYHDHVWAITGDMFPIFPLKLPLPGYDPGVVELVWQSNVWVLRNNTKYHKVFVNQMVLEPSFFFPVQHGDLIEVGNCRFRVEKRDLGVFTYVKNLYLEEQSPIESILSSIRPDETLLKEDVLDLISKSSVHLSEEISPVSSKALIDHLQMDQELIKDAPERGYSELKRLEEAYYQVVKNPEARLEVNFSKMTLEQRFEKPVEIDNALNIEELLCGPMDVDTLIQQIGSFDTELKQGTDTQEDVLCLFVDRIPEQIEPSEHRLPPRTRKDHHSISLDSNFCLTGTIKSPQQTDQ
jgi:hypothetical protein